MERVEHQELRSFLLRGEFPNTVEASAPEKRVNARCNFKRMASVYRVEKESEKLFNVTNSCRNSYYISSILPSIRYCLKTVNLQS